MIIIDKAKTAKIGKFINSLLSPFNLVIGRASDWFSMTSFRRNRDTWLLKEVINKHVTSENIDREIYEQTPHKYTTVYRPTFDGFENYIDDQHKYISSFKRMNPTEPAIAADIPGWLLKADALKLYEMAYFCEGDILEIGCFNGLSTSIMANAIKNSKRKAKIYSIEIDPERVEITKKNLEKDNLEKFVTVNCTDAGNGCDKLIGNNMTFGFAFIDHNHSYEHTYEACQKLPHLIHAGGYCLFHDFTARANFDESCPDYGLSIYGVPHAVLDALSENVFILCGIYGFSALYKKVQ